MTEFEQINGLAGDIRSSLSSEQYDLAGYTESRTHDLIHQAFSQPLNTPTQMIKFTFVVGGGKLVRSRYSDDLIKWMTSALREIGYKDDRSAALDYSCQGTFKQQHDTGQNLKVVIVFPYVTCANMKSTNDEMKPSEQTINVNSKEYIVTACEFSTFCEIVSSKTESWSQRKRLLKILQDSRATFEALEQELMTGVLLSPSEQAIYDANCGCDQEKITWLQGEIKAMVDKGNLTAAEREQLLESFAANLETVAAEVESARAEGKTKKVEKLQEKMAAISARRTAVQGVSPIVHRLRHGDEIQRLVVQLQPLYALEERSRSVALTLADLKTLEGKSDMESRVAELKERSRCWFESDEEFSKRCEYEEALGKSKYEASRKKLSAGKKKSAVTSKSGTQGRIATSTNSTSSWTTNIGKKKTVTSNRVQSSGKAVGGGGFAAAFGGDSSDDDSS
mmetsp:Transcript_16823/g.25295  ORF Transcript_16823/g.25295 Transcript_16823/m.25295 type:complete len:450 (-) Transcript_16823:143-1492(-)